MQQYPEDMTEDGRHSPVIDPGPAIDFDALKNTAQAGEEAGKNSPDAAGASRDGMQESFPCPRCAEAEKGRLIALAELENARKRLARDKEEFMKYAAESVIASILPAIDNLDLALAYAPENDACRNFVIGVDMTRKLLLDALAQHGLVQTGALGESFDPAIHEAMGLEPHAEYVEGQVCGLMNKGYMLKDRLLRPAKVMVCKNET